MKQVNFGATNEKVSELCFGAMMLGTSVDKTTSFQVLDQFLDLGGNFIDTANCYSWWMGKGEFIGDESENMIGQWMKERKNRDKIFLATKVGARLKDPYHIRNADGIPDWDRARTEYEGLSKEVIISAVDNSLRRLQTDYIDLYYTHVYDKNIPIEETMDALNQLVKAGKVRYLGASNLTTDQLKNANQVSAKNGLSPYTALQQEYSYIHPNKGADTGITSHGDKEMFDYMESAGMAFCAYSPLLKGIYLNREKRNGYYNWHLFNSEESIRKLDLVEELSGKLGVTGNQLVLAWMMHHNPRVIPILGFSKAEQLLENIKAYEIELSEDILKLMNE